MWEVEDPTGRPLYFRRFTSYVVYVAAAMAVMVIAVHRSIEE